MCSAHAVRVTGAGGGELDAGQGVTLVHVVAQEVLSIIFFFRLHIVVAYVLIAAVSVGPVVWYLVVVLHEDNGMLGSERKWIRSA